MKKQKLFLGLWAMMCLAAASSCGITVNRVETGPMRTEQLDIAKPADATQAWDVELQPGAASVKIDVGGDKLVDGSIEYNVDDWKPIITNASRHVVIRQNGFIGVPPTNVRNDWKVRLGKGIPMNLTISTGAIRGSLDVGGLSLRTFTYRQGAADSTLSLSQSNVGEMSSFNIDAGASRLTAQGLAYMNAASGKINIGAGAITLIFDGKLTRDLEVTIDGGAAAVTIDSGGNPVQVILNQGLSAVTAKDWKRADRTYNSPEWASAKGAKVIVRANLSAASLTLESGK